MFQRNSILLAIGMLVLLIVAGAGGFMAGRNAGLTEQTNIRSEFFQQRLGNQGGAPGVQGVPGTQPGAPGQQSTQGGAGTRGTQGGAGTQGAQSAPGSDAAQAVQNLQGRQVAAGVVKSVQDNVAQVTQRDGSTLSVTLDDKMSVTKTITGTVADIQPGWAIAIFEQTGNSGTLRRILLTQELGQGQGQGQRSGPSQNPSQKPGQ